MNFMAEMAIFHFWWEGKKKIGGGCSSSGLGQDDDVGCSHPWQMGSRPLPVWAGQTRHAIVTPWRHIIISTRKEFCSTSLELIWRTATCIHLANVTGCCIRYLCQIVFGIWMEKGSVFKRPIWGFVVQQCCKSIFWYYSLDPGMEERHFFVASLICNVQTTHGNI